MFKVRDKARKFFTRLIDLYKNWNYCPPGFPEYEKYKHDIEVTAEQQAIRA